MTGDVQASESVALQASAEPEPVRRRLLRRVLVGLGAVVLLVGLVLLGRWWTHPDLFRDHGDSFRAEPVPLSQGPFHVGTAFHRPDATEPVELTFHDARAYFTKNSAGAEATFWICSSATGFGAGPLDQSCADARPIEAGTEWTYAADPGGEQIVVTVTPSRPGTVRLDRVELSYSLGADHFFRRGTDTIELDARFTAE